MTRKSFVFLVVLVAALMALTACQPIQPASAPTPAEGAEGPATGGPTATEMPQAALNMREVVARQLHIDAAEVIVVAAEAVEWSDSCLGAGQINEMCAAVITPGYRLVFDVSGDRYVFHTDPEAYHYRLVEAPTPALGDVVIEWVGTGEMFECREATIGMEGVSFAPCYGKRMGGELSSTLRRDELARMRATFAPFTATTAAGDLVFHGTGAQEATPAQQRMIAEWASIANLEAGGGRTGAAYGNIFAMTREGGIAALCQTVTAYVTGVAYVVDCRGDTPVALPTIVLDAGQVERLFTLYDSVPIFEVSRTDGTADTMTTKIYFYGRGEGEATDGDKFAVEEFAAELLAQAAALAQEKVTPPAVCGQPGEGEARYVNAAHGYCVNYPRTHLPVEYSPEGTAFVVDGNIMNHMDARLDITVQPAAGQTAQEIATALAEDASSAVGGAPFEAVRMSVAGEEAWQLTMLPGQDLNRIVVVVHGDALYQLRFTPDDPAMAANAAMEELYTLALGSFRFSE